MTSEESDTPEMTLQKHLSIRSVISTTSSFAKRQQTASEALAQQSFRAIGVGTCGRIFEQPGDPLVIKLEVPHSYGGRNLQNDFAMHQRIFAAFKKHQQALDLDVHVPQPFQFVPKSDEDWWDRNGERFPVAHRKPAAIIFMERILPLPRKVREALIDKYCPERIRAIAKQSPGNKDCLVRLYLGKLKRDRSRPSIMFNLRNFNLHINQCTEIDVETEPFARAMADALAIMHWDVKVDAHDVEFVLGSAPTFKEIPHHMSKCYNFERREIHYWLLDFNQVCNISMDYEGVDSAVFSFVGNDRYYPRPGKGFDESWDLFKARYLQTSAAVAAVENQHLPARFIDRLEKKLYEANEQEEAAQERSRSSLER